MDARWIQRLGREARPAHAVRGRGSARAARGEAAAGQQVGDVIGVKIAVGLLGLGLALLPGTTRAAPTDEAPKEGQLDPGYAAGKAAIAAKDWNAAIRSLSSAALRDTRSATSRTTSATPTARAASSRSPSRIISALYSSIPAIVALTSTSVRRTSWPTT